MREANLPAWQPFVWLFQSAPKELEESAFLDGATQWVAYRHITLPLALPSIAVAALIAFLIGYSEFAMSWLFVDRSQNVTRAMAISGMIRGGTESWSNLAPKGSVIGSTSC